MTISKIAKLIEENQKDPNQLVDVLKRFIDQDVPVPICHEPRALAFAHILLEVYAAEVLKRGEDAPICREMLLVAQELLLVACVGWEGLSAPRTMRG